MKPAFELVDIRIVDLRELPDPGFEGTAQDLVNFAQTVLCCGGASDEMLAEQARKTDTVKAKRFEGLVLSVRDRGYKALGINSDRSYYEEHFRPLALQHPLITVCVDTQKYVDGNHRAATLRALGVKFFPAARVRWSMVPDELEDAYSKRYMSQYDACISDFLRSEIWQNYMRTDCYTRSFGRVSDGKV